MTWGVQAVQHTYRSTRFWSSWAGGAIAAGVVVGGLVGTVSAAARAGADDDKDKPKLSLRASPAVAFAPARIYVVAEIKGGPDDYEKFYCASVEWDWGDGTRSEASADCEPYEAGKSEIKRRYPVEHMYRVAGNYRIQFRLKQKNDPVAAVNTTVRIQPGLGGTR